MKRVIAAIAVLISVMCFAYAYRLQVLGMIQTDVVAISDRNLAKTLQEGANGDKEPDAVMLEKFQAGDTVYQRGSNLYLGDKKERVQSDYPFYTGDGTGIWYFQATGSLITDDFMEYEPYAGLYVSDGTAFDEDGVGQDEDTYIFAKLNNGLYMNTVPVTIRSNGVDHALRLGSLISFQEDAVSSYSYAGDRLVYAGLAHLLDAKVVIRDKTYDYDSFLKQLGVLHDPTQPVVKADEPEETIAAESGSSEEAQRRNGSRQSDISETAAALEDAVSEGQGTDGSAAEDMEAQLEDTPEGSVDSELGHMDEDLGDGLGDPISSDSAGSLGDSSLGGDSFSSGSGGGDTGGSSSGNSTGSSSGSGGSDTGNSGSGDGSSTENGGNSGYDHGNNQGGNSTAGGSGSGGGSNDNAADGSGTGTDMGDGGGNHGDSDGNNNNGGHGSSDSTGGSSGGNSGGSMSGDVRKPVIALTNVSADVYNVYGELAIQDPDMRLRRVVLRVYREENGQEKELLTRKNFKTRGSITIPNVRPDTSILVQGTFVWNNKDGEKVTESFMEDIPLRTLSLDHLAPYTFTSTKAVKFYSDRIQIPEMQTSSSRPADLMYIAKGILEVRKKGETSLATDEPLTLAGSDIRSLRQGHKSTWVSDGILDSGTEYEWKLTLKDRFDNVLPYTSESVLSGSTRTSYKAPSVSISMVGNAVGSQQLRITVINEDSQYIHLRDGYMVLCDPQTGAPLSVFEQIGDDPETKLRRKLDLNQNSLNEEITNLPSGRNYRIEIYGTYDLRDTDPEASTVNARLGQTSIYTAAISNLGTASYEMSVSDVTASSANVQFHLSSYTYSLLIQLMSQIKVTVSAPANGSREIVLNKAEWDSVNIADLKKDGDAYVLYPADAAAGTPEVVLNYLGTAADSTSVWTALTEFTTVEVRYPEGKFTSKTQYRVNVQTTVTQANEEYDVSSSASVAEFQTKKTPPTVNCGELLVISDFAELYNFRIDDPDGTVTDGKVNLRLYAGERLVDSRFVETNRTYSAANEGEEALMSFQNLSSNMDYTIRIYASEYNEGYDSSEKKDNYAFPSSSWLRFKTGSGITGKVELRDLADVVDEKQKATIRVTLKDPESDLLKDSENPTYLLEYRKVEGRDISDAELDAAPLMKREGGNPEVKKLTVIDHKVQDVSEEFTLDSDLYCTYDIRLIVEVKGHRVTLGRLTYETGEKIYTITKEEDFQLLKDHREGKFIVLNDITATGKVTSIGSSDNPFNGQLDFQGYTLRRNGSQLFQYIGSRGVVENLELYYTVKLSNRLNEGAGICWRNYGTIRNVIAHVDIQGRYPSKLGGLVYNNYASGVIENFAVEIADNGLYVGYNTGGASYSNAGTVRNGYVYGGNILVGSGVFGGDSSGSRGSVGGLVGTNSGQVYNCFTLNQVQIEKGENMNSVGLAVGTNWGRVRNVLSVGDVYMYEYDDDKKQTTPQPLLDYGGTVGYDGGTIKDIYLLSEGNFAYGQNGGSAYKKAELIEARTLRSASWHQSCFNSEGAFEVENMVQAGYYPRLSLPDALMSKQTTIGLPLVGISAYPDIISSTVREEGRDEQGRDYALVDLEFYNPNRYQITGLDVSGLIVEVQEGQGASESTYQVTVKLLDPTTYRSVYNVNRVYYRGAGTTINQYDYIGRTIQVSFYKPVNTLSDWKAIGEDLAGNYRLESDLDFSGAYSSDVRIKGKFTGILDGKDLDGTLHTLENMQEIQSGSIFENVNGGTIRNLTVEGLKLDSSTPSETLHTGFVGTLNGSATLDHVFIVGSGNRKEVSVYGYGGALVGEVNNATVTNCGVRDMELTSKEIRKNTLYLGGLVGSLSAAQLNNCYAQGVTITAEAGYTASGIGGLIGVQGSGSVMNSLYAQGSIKTSFQNAGGITGSAGSAISKAWTYVEINSIADNLGGIAGKLAASLSIENVVEMGNIYTTSSNTGDSGTVRRIAGSVGTFTYTARNTVAYSGQLLGKAAADQLMDANRLVSLPELWTRNPYRDYAVLGASFDISGTKSGGAYTAENGILPMLLDTDGNVLENQEPISLPDPSLKLKATGTRDESTNEYGLVLEVEGMYDTEQKKYLYEPVKVEVPGMALADIKTGVDSKEIESKTDQYGTVSYTWKKLTIQSYLDSYQVTVTLQKPGGGAVQVLTASFEYKNPLYHDIANAQQFIDQMTAYGQNYENFRIMADIDLSGYKDVQIPKNLKINRLVGAGEGHSISGINYQIQSQGESLIQVLSGTMENLTWKNIIITSADATKVSGGTNIGLISINQGEIRNSAFENISIIAPKSSQKTGVIGTSVGTLSNLKLKDIRVSATGSYIGGLCGLASGTIDGVEAVGTLNSNNYQYSINGGEPNSNGVSHVGGLIGRLDGEAQHLSAEGIQVIGSKNVGGLIGSTNDPSGPRKYYGFRVGVRTVTSDADTADPTEKRGARTGTNKDADGNVIIRNKVNGYEYVGGIFGQSSQSEDTNYYDEIYNTDVNASYRYAGGYMGSSGWVYPCYIVGEDLTVTAMAEYAGGLYGYYGSGRYMLVNHVTVSGSDYTSGVYGLYAHTHTNNCLLENSVISGANYVSGYVGKRYYDIDYSNLGVYNCSITATGNYAGGIFAQIEPRSIYRCYVSHTDVKAQNYAGGLAAELRCGRVYGCEIGADVTASQAAGGLAGRMYSYLYDAGSPSSYPYTTLFRNIVAGTANATTTLAGGLAGEFLPGDNRLSSDGSVVAEAPEDMTETYFYSNLLALTRVSSGDSKRGFIAYNNNRGLADAGKLKNSYIWEGTVLGASGADASSGLLAGKSTVLTGNTGVKTVTTEQLSKSGSNTDSAYYYVTRPDMSYWNETDAFKGNFLPYSKATDALEIKQGDTQSITGLSMQSIGAGIPIPQGAVATQSIPEAELPTVDIYASGAGTINLEFDRDVTKDAENGFGMRPVVDGEPEDGEAVDESAETGAESESENRSGGSAVQSSGSLTARAVADADGADTDNAQTVQNDTTDTEDADILYDMDAAFAYGDMEAAAPEYRVRILSGGEVLADEAITGRVMTFSYDYQTPLTAEVTDGFNSEQYEIDPEALAHSVMVYGDSWYYLTAGGVGTPDGVVAGEYIHLFNGSALDLDGNITDLGGGSGSVSGNAVRMDTTPLYEWDYAGYDLLVFKNFTWSVDDAAEAVSLLSAADGADELSDLSDADDEVTELPYQAIVKNGEMSLFNAENPVSPDGWIIDNYQGESFMTVLGEDGKLADIGQDEIKMPEDFQNSYIGEVSNTAYADAPIVVGRYNSGKVFAFNYLTGENLEVVQSDDDMLDLVDYARQWISDKTDSMFKSARSSYLAAANLGSNVDLNEVKRLYDGTNGSGTQNSIAGVLRGNTVEGAGGDPGQSDSGVRSNEQKEAGDGNGTAGGTTAANTVQTGEAGDGGDKTGSETGAKKNGVQSSKNDGADLNDSEDADEAEDAENADEESSESKKSSKNSSVKKVKSNRAKSNVSDSEKESPESESLKKETSKSDSKTQSDSEKDSQAAVQSGEGAKAALDGTQTDVEKSADRKTGTGPAGDTAAEREKAGTGGRSGEAGNGAEPSGSEAGAPGQSGTEAGAAGNTGAGQSGTEAGAAGSAGTGQSGTEAGAEAGAAGDAGTGQSGTEAGAAGSTGAGQSGTEAGAAGQAGADANAAGSAASGQTGTKLGTDKVAAAISSHDAERTKEALNSSWLPVYDAASGEYKLYNAGELLSSNGGVVLSAEEKMEALSRQGINVNYGQVNAGAHHTDSEKQGFKILGGIAAAILLILGSFWLRRRNAK